MKKGQLILFIIVIESFLTPAFAMHLSFATQNLEPFSYLSKEGYPSGPSIDIANAVCEEIKADCVIDLYPWRRAYYEVKMARVNGVFFIGKNPEREEWLKFSPPIIQTEYGFFVNKHNPIAYKNPIDITGYIVGVFGPSNTSASLNKIKHEMSDFYIDMEDNDESGFRKLSVERVNAVYSNRDVGYSLLNKLKLENIRYAGPHRRLSYYFGFNPQLTPTRWIQLFNQAYVKLFHSGKIREILKKYHMEPAPLEENSLSNTKN
ncbi:MAG: ABC transporter substrate-binding protein [Candidatus Magnetomorum sp.]|nr:ABC transporter substrate-binding protein [Candidatus Magnetomorum sp.]